MIQSLRREQSREQLIFMHYSTLFCSYAAYKSSFVYVFIFFHPKTHSFSRSVHETPLRWRKASQKRKKISAAEKKKRREKNDL